MFCRYSRCCCVDAAGFTCLTVFCKQSKGFDMAETLLAGVEPRTSSPVRPRRDQDGQSLSTRGLFPPGGILFTGMDGIRAAEWMATAMIASGFAPAN